MAQQYAEAIPVSEIRLTGRGGHHDTKLYVLPGREGLWRRLSSKAIKELPDEDDDTIEAALVRDGKIMHKIASLKVTAFRRYLKISTEEASRLADMAGSGVTLTVNEETPEETPPF